MVFFRTVALNVLPCIFWLQSAVMPNRHRLRLKLRCENHPSLTLIAASRQLVGFHGGVGSLGKLVMWTPALGRFFNTEFYPNLTFFSL
jgi:hypothetical protein